MWLAKQSYSEVVDFSGALASWPWDGREDRNGGLSPSWRNAKRTRASMNRIRLTECYRTSVMLSFYPGFGLYFHQWRLNLIVQPQRCIVVGFQVRNPKTRSSDGRPRSPTP